MELNNLPHFVFNVFVTKLESPSSSNWSYKIKCICIIKILLYELEELDVINVNLRDLLKGHIFSSNINIFPIFHIVTGKLFRTCTPTWLTSLHAFFLTGASYSAAIHTDSLPLFSTSAHTAIPRVAPQVVLLADPI